MGASALLERGSVFGAEHDSSYEFWVSPDPRWKLCLAFNATPPSFTDDVHYFIATSQVSYFREHPQFASDVVIFAPNAYPFFPQETAMDFRDLRIVPLAKLQQKGFKPLGRLRASDIAACEATARSARLLENPSQEGAGAHLACPSCP